ATEGGVDWPEWKQPTGVGVRGRFTSIVEAQVGASGTRRTDIVAERDLRIDFFRGLALWMIFTDHIGDNRFQMLTYHKLGFSDAAEIFIFLSGLSCDIADGRILARDGYWAAQRRTLRRARQIYVGYLLSMAASFAAALALRHWLTPRAIDELELAPLLANPWGASLHGALL